MRPICVQCGALPLRPAVRAGTVWCDRCLAEQIESEGRRAAYTGLFKLFALLGIPVLFVMFVAACYASLVLRVWLSTGGVIR